MRGRTCFLDGPVESQGEDFDGPVWVVFLPLNQSL